MKTLFIAGLLCFCFALSAFGQDESDAETAVAEAPEAEETGAGAEETDAETAAAEELAPEVVADDDPLVDVGYGAGEASADVAEEEPPVEEELPPEEIAEEPPVEEELPPEEIAEEPPVEEAPPVAEEVPPEEPPAIAEEVPPPPPVVEAPPPPPPAPKVRDVWTPADVPVLSTGKRPTARNALEVTVPEVKFAGASVGFGLSDLFPVMNGSTAFNFSKLSFDRGVASVGTAANFNLKTEAKFPVKDLFIMDAAINFVDLYASFGLSDETLSCLNNMDEAKPGMAVSGDSDMQVGLSQFWDLGVGGSKTLLDDRLWVRAAPSLFFTIMYMEQQNVNLEVGNMENNELGLRGVTDSTVHLYSAYDFFGGDGGNNIFASPGLDLSLEARYALLPMLDVGLALSRVPVIPSKLGYRTDIKADTMVFDPDGSSVNFDTGIIAKNKPVTTKADNWVMRPTRFEVYGIVKPFRTPRLLVRPNIGGSLNKASGNTFNAGVDVQYNTPGIFSAFAGVGQTEGIWSNELGLTLDFNRFELDLGMALAGRSFPESWTGAGMSAQVALKFGY